MVENKTNDQILIKLLDAFDTNLPCTNILSGLEMKMKLSELSVAEFTGHESVKGGNYGK